MSVFRVLWLLFVATVVLGSAAGLIVGFGSEPDPSKRCVGASRHRCFSREPAVVTKASTDPIHVSYDDGVRSTAIYLRADTVALERGSRVWLERWDGDIVSISDPGSERRYRSEEWVDRWSGRTFWFPLGLLLGALAVLSLTVRRRRGRPRTAATG